MLPRPGRRREAPDACCPVMTVSLRPENAADEAFLHRLVTEFSAEQLGAAAWPEPFRTRLLDMQYFARRDVIRTDYPNAASSIVTVDGADAGWLVTARLENEVRVIDILLLPEYRGRGAGTAVIRQVIEAAGGLPVRLSVDANNRCAIRLYERLGFRRTGGDAVQHEMECTR